MLSLLLLLAVATLTQQARADALTVPYCPLGGTGCADAWQCQCWYPFTACQVSESDLQGTCVLTSQGIGTIVLLSVLAAVALLAVLCALHVCRKLWSCCCCKRAKHTHHHHHHGSQRYEDDDEDDDDGL